MERFRAKRFEVVIIESLDRQDRKTGQLLSEGSLRHKMSEIEGGRVDFNQVNSKEEFFHVLEKITEDIKNESLYPIIHLEVHGSEDGICINNGDCISWSEILPKLVEINTLVQNTLILVLGVCKGIKIIKYLGIQERAPFRVVVGSLEDLDTDTIEVGFESFYETFFFSSDVGASVFALRESVGKDSIGVELVENLYDGIRDPNRDPAAYQKGIDDSFLLLKEKSIFEGKNLSDEVLMNNAIYLVEKLFSDLAKNRDYFLMSEFNLDDEE